MRTRALAALALLVLIVTPVLAMPRSTDEPLAFVPVPGVGASVGEPRRIDPSVRPSPSHLPALSPLPTRPIVDIPEPPVIVVDVGNGSGVDTSGGHSVAGVASWYCGHGSRCSSGYGQSCRCAAAGPALRAIAGWRGSWVDVQAGSRSVRVRLIDCNCGPNANLIDLYASAFEQLAPLSQGVVKVTVSWP